MPRPGQTAPAAGQAGDETGGETPPPAQGVRKYKTAPASGQAGAGTGGETLPPALGVRKYKQLQLRVRQVPELPPNSGTYLTPLPAEGG